jgi:CheY-like chemotaxis protein
MSDGHAKRTTILLVDDDVEVLAAVKLWLDPRFDVHTAANGGAALGILDAKHMDAIVLDLMMPIMDGWAFKRELDRRGVRAPVVLMSAHADVERQARAIGVAAFLVKPVEPADLESELDRLLAAAPANPRPPTAGAGG